MLFSKALIVAFLRLEARIGYKYIRANYLPSSFVAAVPVINADLATGDSCYGACKFLFFKLIVLRMHIQQTR
jgi:hypothetical protein